MDFNKHPFGEAMRMLVAVNCWMIWKVRNEMIFKHKRINDSIFIFLKRESLQYCINNNLVLLTQSILWHIDPKVAISNSFLSNKSKFVRNLREKFDLVAFSDVSWDQEMYKSGIGGFIISKNQSVLYIFSCRCEVGNAFQAEVAGCMHLCITMGLNRPNHKGVICVDSKNLCDPKVLYAILIENGIVWKTLLPRTEKKQDLLIGKWL